MENTNTNGTRTGGPRNISALGKFDLNVPLPERLERITSVMGNPYAYVSSNGLKMKINHTGKRPIDDALFEHFTGGGRYLPSF